MSRSTDHIRVIVLGDSGVGKTSFCRMLCARDLPPEEARKATGVNRAQRLVRRVSSANTGWTVGVNVHVPPPALLPPPS